MTQASDRHTADGGRRRALAAVAGLLLAALLAFGAALLRAPSPPVAATVLPTPIPLPAFELESGSGEAFTPESLEGRVSLLFFGFTHCPDICPLTLARLANLRSTLAENGAETLPDVVFVSVDPARDGISEVAAYASAFGEHTRGVRGPLTELDKLTATLGIFHGRPETADGYTVEHSGAVIVIDSQARFAAVISSPDDVDVMVEDWPKLIAALGNGA